MAVYIDIYSDYGQIKGGIKVADIDAVQNKLTNLLRCPIGSRFRQPLFGVRLWEFIHEPCDDFTAEQIQDDFFQAIIKWMPEIQVFASQISVVPLSTGDGFACNLPYFVPRLEFSGSLSFNARRD